MGNKGGRLGTTLVLALVIVVLGIALGVGLARYGSTLPVVGSLIGEKPPRTTTGPVVVEGVHELDQLATVRWTESVPVTRESGGDILDRLFSGEKVIVIATGNVEAGVNLGDIHKDDVSVSGETVTIDLPEPEILSSSLDEEWVLVPVETIYFGYLFGVFFLFLCLAAFLANQFHKWAHMEAPPAFAGWLQARGVILSKEHHDIHHESPYDTYYCITVGFWNPLLDRTRFFERVERLIR